MLFIKSYIEYMYKMLYNHCIAHIYLRVPSSESNLKLLDNNFSSVMKRCMTHVLGASMNLAEELSDVPSPPEYNHPTVLASPCP